MTVRVSCCCGKGFRAEGKYSGQQFTCTICQRVLALPGPATANRVSAAVAGQAPCRPGAVAAVVRPVLKAMPVLRPQQAPRSARVEGPSDRWLPWMVGAGAGVLVILLVWVVVLCYQPPPTGGKGVPAEGQLASASTLAVPSKASAKPAVKPPKEQVDQPAPQPPPQAAAKPAPQAPPKPAPQPPPEPAPQPPPQQPPAAKVAAPPAAAMEAQLAVQPAQQQTSPVQFDPPSMASVPAPSGLSRPTFAADPRLGRILKKPVEGEVTSGQAANILLPLLRRLDGPAIEIAPELLEQINVNGGQEEASLGALKKLPRLFWPLALRGPQQQELAQLLCKAVAATLAGTLDAELYGLVKKGVERLRADTRQRFYRDEIDGTTYLHANRFLADLEGAVRQLGRPEAALFLKGVLAAKGGTISKLVQHMTQQQLRFAPASPGCERAYWQLHVAMIQYLEGSPTDLAALLPAKPAVAATNRAESSAAKPAAPAVTVWRGTETLVGYGPLEFRFLHGGQAVMVDAAGVRYGSCIQRGGSVTIAFPQSATYFGVIRGRTMSGTARVNNRVWTWSVQYEERGSPGSSASEG